MCVCVCTCGAVCVSVCVCVCTCVCCAWDQGPLMKILSAWRLKIGDAVRLESTCDLIELPHLLPGIRVYMI